MIIKQSYPNWIELPVPTPTIGAGWSMQNPYYVSDGTNAPVIFPCNFKAGKIYELKINDTYIPNTGTNRIIVQISNDTQKKVLNDTNPYISSMLIDDLTFDATRIEIYPDHNGSNFWLRYMYEQIVTESHISKNRSIYLGGGGKYSRSNSYSGNVAIGHKALERNLGGSANIAIGAFSQQQSTFGQSNISIGESSLTANYGSGNTAIGNGALARNIAGTDNCAIGGGSLFYNTTGSRNTTVGSEAMRLNKSGSLNTSYGQLSLFENVDGSNNVAVGDMAGYSGIHNGHVEEPPNAFANRSKGVFIGSKSAGIGGDNQIVIGANAMGNGANTITLGNSDSERLYCKATTITALSDTRIKEDIEAADLDLCVKAVKELPVTRYKYKDYVGKYNDKHVTGFLADDVEKVFPKAVSTTDKYFPVLDEEGQPIYEEITLTNKELDNEGNEIEKETPEKKQKQFLMESVKDITMTEALPTLWGAVQGLIQRIEVLEKSLGEQK